MKIIKKLFISLFILSATSGLAANVPLDAPDDRLDRPIKSAVGAKIELQDNITFPRGKGTTFQLKDITIEEDRGWLTYLIKYRCHAKARGESKKIRLIQTGAVLTISVVNLKVKRTPTGNRNRGPCAIGALKEFRDVGNLNLVLKYRNSKNEKKIFNVFCKKVDSAWGNKCGGWPSIKNRGRMSFKEFLNINKEFFSFHSYPVITPDMEDVVEY